MKTAKYFLLLVTAALILSVPAFASPKSEPDLSLINKSESDLPLINKSDPVLAGIEPLCVVVLHSGSEPDKAGLLWKNIARKVESELKKAGVDVIAIPDNNLPPEIPELRITVDLFRHENSNRYFMDIQTSLARLVYIEKNGSVSTKAEVWQIGPALDVSSLENLQVMVMRHVSKQVDVFINACIAAGNVPKSSDANNVSAARRSESAGKSDSGQYPYVAARNSKIFHKADCPIAAKIKPEILVGYDTRDDALAAGKIPCRQCKP